MKRISVIVPVYNVEKYLRRCVDSIINQTYQNLEIILVDDGSPDNCPAICDEYAKIDPRIKVIHKINGGLSSARNAALDWKELSGDFITFVDSDDWIAYDTYEYCTNLLERYHADVVQFDFTYATDTNMNLPIIDEIVYEYEGKDILQHFMTVTTKRSGGYSACRCIFKKDIIGNLRFRNGKINEDIDWKYKVLKNSLKMIDSNQVKYFYYQSTGSTTTDGLKKRDFDLREAADILAELTSVETYGTIAKLGKVKHARTAFSLLSKIAYYGISDKTLEKDKLIRELTDEHRKNLRILLNSPIPLSRKVLSILFAINFNLTAVIVQLAKKI